MNDRNYRERILIIQKLFQENRGKKLTRSDIITFLAGKGIETNKQTVGCDIDVLMKFMPILKEFEKREMKYYLGAAKIVIEQKQCTPSELPGYPCKSCTADKKSNDCQCLKWKTWAMKAWAQFNAQGKELVKSR